MVVSNIAEPVMNNPVSVGSKWNMGPIYVPMNLRRICEQTQTNGVNWSIAPSFIVKAARAIQMIEVSRVLLTPEELHITDLKVGPEVASRVPICIFGVLWSQLVVCQPVQHIVVGQISGVCGKELLRLWPESWDTLGSVEKVDGETVCDVAVFYESEHIVVNVTEELNLGLDTPIVTVVLKGRVLIEQATVPAAHLMVGYLVAILNALLLQHLGGLAEEVHVDPIGDIPVFLRYLL